jgi:hypothetical protein
MKLKAEKYKLAPFLEIASTVITYAINYLGSIQTAFLKNSYLQNLK